MFTNAEAKEFGMNYYYNYSNTTGPPLDDVNIIWSFLLTSRSDLVVGGKICHHFSQKKGPKRWPFYPVLKANQCEQLSISLRWLVCTWFVKGEIDENGNTNRYWCKNVNFLLHFSMVFDWNFWCGIYWWNLPQNVEKSRGSYKGTTAAIRQVTSSTSANECDFFPIFSITNNAAFYFIERWFWRQILFIHLIWGWKLAFILDLLPTHVKRFLLKYDNTVDVKS